MLSAIFAHTADTSVGRFDPTMLNDQSRMEMLVTPIEDDRAILVDDVYLEFKNNTDDFLDIQKWPGVTCNEGGDVVSIDWSLENWACGEVSFDLLPENLVFFDSTKGLFNEWVIRGTISTELLPRVLETFIMNGHAIGGTIDLTQLPPAMKTFKAFGNVLEGTINLESLPSTMQKLDLSHNKLCGSPSLTKVPASVKRLLLDRNYFEGSEFKDQKIR